MNKVETVAVLGTGVIGASWAALFLARGLDVVASDPAPDAEAKLRSFVDDCWPSLVARGLTPDAERARLRFTPNPEDAVAQADFVQENAPERLDIKTALIMRIEPVLKNHAVVATSSSAMPVSMIQRECRRPDKLINGHPFNPPHLIPLVEISGGVSTDRTSVDRAVAFYESIGQRPIVLKREAVGFVANRLQAALFREAFNIVREGIASTRDVDTAISQGPGLRWALLGPFHNLALSGGEGGIRHTFEHLGTAISSMWDALGTPQATAQLFDQIADDFERTPRDHTLAELKAQRDALLVALLNAKLAVDFP